MMRALRWWSILVLLGVYVSCASAQEYFGTFLDQLSGTFNVRAQPRPTFKLRQTFRFRDPNGLVWSTPANVEVNGASIPQPFWSFIGGPFEGPYISASVIHDHYCRTKERTAHDTHRNFYYGMRANSVPEWKASFMYWAVATFGPSWKLERRVVTKQSCQPAAPGSEATCTSLPSLEDVLVSSPGVDLSDPEILAAALSKANAVAKTLLTSDGAILDVVSGGTVPADPSAIAASAEIYRKVFTNKEFAIAPHRLGVLTVDTSGFSSIEPWAGNRLPKFEEASVLTRDTQSGQFRNVGVRAGPGAVDVLQQRIDFKSLSGSSKFELRP